MRKMSIQDYKSQTEISNFEELNDLAEDVITSLRFDLFEYDKCGNLIDRNQIPAEKYKESVEDFLNHPEKNVLYFSENTELKEYSFQDAQALSFAEIRERYLKDVLPIARRLMREDPQFDFGRHVSNTVSDEDLDNILILRWKENLKLWAAQWEYEKNHSLDFNPGGIRDKEIKNIPFYDPYVQIWKVEVDGRQEEGDLLYVASEFAKTGLLYHFNVKGASDEIPNHEHSFNGVIHSLILNPLTFTIEGFEAEYSEQEMAYLDAVQKKMFEITGN